MISTAEKWLPFVEKLMVDLIHPSTQENFLGEIVKEHLATGGKRLRSCLALAATEVLGGDPFKAVPWAAACELLHNATLIHDDIQDGDVIRRGHPTIWKKHGIAQAINAGDLMLMLPFLAASNVSVSESCKFLLLRSLASHCEQTVRGQALEPQLLDFLGSPQLFELYINCVTQKTSALFKLPVEGAAIIAGLDETKAVEVSQTFSDLGVLFQIQDDVLDLFGTKGRDIQGTDIQEGKVSALVVHHLLLKPQDRETLELILRKPRWETSLSDIQEVRSMFLSSGALDKTMDHMGQLVEKTRQSAELKSLTDELLLQILKPVTSVLSSERVHQWLEHSL